MELYLAEFSNQMAPGAHAVLMLDQADWQVTQTIDAAKYWLKFLRAA